MRDRWYYTISGSLASSMYIYLVLEIPWSLFDFPAFTYTSKLFPNKLDLILCKFKYSLIDIDIARVFVVIW